MPNRGKRYSELEKAILDLIAVQLKDKNHMKSVVHQIARFMGRTPQGIAKQLELRCGWFWAA